MMRIAHFIHQANADQAHVRAAFVLCEALAARGHEVTLFTAAAFDVPLTWKSGNPGLPRVEEVAPLGGRFSLQTRWSRRFLSVRLAGMDALHIHGDWTIAEAQVEAVAKRLEVACVHSLARDAGMSVEAAEAKYTGALEGAELAAAASRLAASA